MINNPEQKAQKLVTYLTAQAPTLPIAVTVFNTLAPLIKINTIAQLTVLADQELA